MKLSELHSIESMRWVIGNMGSGGLMLKSRGLTIRMNATNAEELIDSLRMNKDVVITTVENKKFEFTPKRTGVNVTSVEKQVIVGIIPQEDLDQILSIGNENEV